MEGDDIRNPQLRLQKRAISNVPGHLMLCPEMALHFKVLLLAGSNVNTILDQEIRTEPALK